MNDPIIIDRSEEQKNLRVQQLRAELDAMGYHVVKKDWVRKFGVERLISLRELHEAIDGTEKLREYVFRSMGQQLGAGIFESGAMRRTSETLISGSYGHAYRATVDILLRDPQFDKPEWLK